MQVIEKMSDGDFDEVCDAGVDLVKALTLVLKRHGLGVDQASNVLAVAAAGVAKSMKLNPSDFVEAVISITPMWRHDTTDESGTGVVFDPAHRQPDFVPVIADPALGN